MVVALNFYNIFPPTENSLTAASTSAPTTDYASQKNSAGNPSGPGGLLFGMDNNVDLISSSIGTAHNFSKRELGSCTSSKSSVHSLWEEKYPPRLNLISVGSKIPPCPSFAPCL